MFCPNCGTNLPDNATFCTQCGAAMNAQQTQAQNATYQSTPQGGYYQQPQYAQAPVGYEQKSKLAAGLLGILVGGLGVHNFYLGYTGKAIAQLLITVLSFGALSPISSIWCLIEGIMILAGSIKVDGKNIPLKD